VAVAVAMAVAVAVAMAVAVAAAVAVLDLGLRFCGPFLRFLLPVVAAERRNDWTLRR